MGDLSFFLQSGRFGGRVMSESTIGVGQKNEDGLSEMFGEGLVEKNHAHSSVITFVKKDKYV
jgi:hypothetical protein